MGLRTLMGVAALACVFAIPANIGASAAPLAKPMTLADTGIETDELVQKVGHRHRKHRYHRRGITYVGPHGLRYAPRYYHRRHGPNVSVTIRIGPRHGYRYRQRAHPWVYDVPKRRVVSGRSASHYRWCDLKYRSYRYRDNTFQPYHGPRKQCRSPYY